MVVLIVICSESPSVIYRLALLEGYERSRTFRKPPTSREEQLTERQKCSQDHVTGLLLSLVDCDVTSWDVVC